MLVALDPAGSLARFGWTAGAPSTPEASTLAPIPAEVLELLEAEAIGVTATGPDGTVYELGNGDLTVVLSLDELALVVELADPDLELEAGTWFVFASDLATFSVALAHEVTAGVYGATFADVEALVPNVTVGYDRDRGVTRADVRRFLELIDARTASRLGEWDDVADADAGVAARLTTAARDLVALGAAAYVEDAAHPDRVDRQADRRYGAVLWDRYTAGIEQLETDLADARADLELDELADVDDGPAIVAPRPAWRRDRPL